MPAHDDEEAFGGAFPLTVNAKAEWSMAASSERRYFLIAQHANSSRAKCRICDELIKKDVLRIGKPVKWQGIINAWFHAKCFFVNPKDDFFPPDKTLIQPSHIFGYDQLNDDDQEQIREALKREEETYMDEAEKEFFSESNKDDNSKVEIGIEQAKKIDMVEPPSSLQLNLLPFQKEGLSWMMAQERSAFRGGVLADEMGMGKTIQTLAMILKQKQLERDIGCRCVGPTLVVCPASAVLQWEEEISRCSGGTLKVLVFHGSQKIVSVMTPREVINHDIVLTTYPTLERGYRICVDLDKVPCQYCGKKFLKAKLFLHNKYFCGPNSMRSAKLAKRKRDKDGNHVQDEKQKRATEKAMATLKITNSGSADLTTSIAKAKSSLPTPVNIYKELMSEANKTPISMYAKKSERMASQSASSATVSPIKKTMKKKKIINERKVKFESIDDLKNYILWSMKLKVKKPSSEGGDPKQIHFVQQTWASQKKGEPILYVSNMVAPLDKEDPAKQGPVLLKPIDLDTETETLTLCVVDNANILIKLTSTSFKLSVDSGGSFEDVAGGSWVGSGKFDDDKANEKRNKGKVRAIGLVNNAPIIVLGPAEKENEWIFASAAGFEDVMTTKELGSFRRRTVLQSFFDKAARNASPFRPSKQEGTKKQRGNKSKGVDQDDDFRWLLRAKNIEPGIDSSKLKPMKKENNKSNKSSDDEDDSDYDEQQSMSDDSDSEASVPSTEESVDDDSEDDVDEKLNSAAEDEDIESIPTRFLAVDWGMKSPKFDLLMKKSKPSPATSRKRKAKSSNKGKGKSKKTKASTKKAKGRGDLEDDVSEFDVDSSSSESDESESPIAEDDPKGVFWYADPGDVVDELGADLGASLLHSIAWKRVIIDEAHKIKDRTNSTAKAVFALRGLDESEKHLKNPEARCYRWCLTGTPLQNRVGELHALVRFLKMDPFAYYFCSVTDCKCRHLHWSFGPTNKKCTDCGHTPMRHFSHFNKHILNPIKRQGFSGEGKRAMRMLRVDLLEKIMLRRTKSQREQDLNLPRLNVEVVSLKLTEPEQDFYEAVYKNTRARFNNFVDEGTVLHNYAHIFELLSRLRRSADHPYLVIHGKNKTMQVEDYDNTPLNDEAVVEDNVDADIEPKSPAKLVPISSKSNGLGDICGICNESIIALTDCALGACRHTFHKNCATQLITSNIAAKAVSECPICFLPLSVTMGFRDGTSTSKVAALEAQQETDKENGDLCVICFDKPRDALLVPCGHLYSCTGCIQGLKNRLCPICRSPIKKVVKSTAAQGEDNPEANNAKVIGRASILQRLSLKNFESSTKIDAVVTEVQKLKHLPVRPEELPHKAIIFSQYSDMIDLVEWKLRSSGLQPVKLVGSMSIKERQSVLKAFRESPDVSVILMSLKAGGEGLNLQVASHVFILETWWNPQVHNQAFQRAHRIGQTRNVRAVLFVTEGTIEARMHELQQKKELVFQSAVEGDVKAMRQLTGEDLRFLFSQ